MRFTLQMTRFDSKSLRRFLCVLEGYIRATVSADCVYQQGVPDLPITPIKHAVFLYNTCGLCHNRLHRSWRSTECWRLWSYECIRSTGMLGYTGKLFSSPLTHEPVLTRTMDASPPGTNLDSSIKPPYHTVW